jgi:signal transduction histidine kinase
VRKSRKGVRYAVLGFLLIALVVLGGMTWATTATWQLAKWNVEDEHAARVEEAVARMDRDLLGVLKSEAARDYSAYTTLATPDALLSRTLQEVDPRDFLQPSPLARTRPRHDWIELYFQVDEAGRWTSPHLPPEEMPWLAGIIAWDESATNRARHALAWLRETLAVEDLKRFVTSALERDRAVGNDGEASHVVTIMPQPPERRPPAPLTNTGKRPVTRKTVNTRGDQQRVPAPKCLPSDIAAGNMQKELRGSGWENVEPTRPFSWSEITFSPLVPVWLTMPDPQGRGLKVAFVRTTTVHGERVEAEGVDVDDQTYYQGFVADWDRLRRELLKRIEDLFPRAELEPVLEPYDAERMAAATIGEREMEQLPARLVVPDAGEEVAAAAWQSVRGVLVTSWAAALVVLAAAGWGVWNLLALTERRLQFAYAVTHELRTPLTTFRLYSDMLAAGLVPETARQEYLDTLNRESQRLSTLVEDVLEYARLENQKLRLTPTEIEGRGLLNMLAENLEQRCKASGVKAETRNRLPDGKVLRTDVDMVNQITGVLVNNACRYAKSSTDPTVILQLDGHDGKVFLDVVDTGPGIDRSDARRIFKPFRRGRNADKLAQGGIGLGLSLARSWASLIGGRLDLVARHDPQYGGAHFRLTLPTQLNG